ncbi:hypothetical protein B0T16DRAFT_412413 [Cercophora newfieldiana]|uniref:Chitin deacetylase n=1 Tax=Cercophora newfieldiana TaxID=92897 RepID=A0AA40CP21_9PEZI|nr:hypothetical protein B0T16DRAFT_412413 [Cercophora newfieldiana]
MRLSSTFVAALFGLTAAHGDHEGQHIPKLLGGRRFLAELRARQGTTAHSSTAARAEPMGPARRQHSLHSRQIDDNIDGRCGPGVGSCAPGYCCSSEGWCGKAKEYCSAPDCQINYGSGCDGNKKPDGLDTFSIPRTKVGKILYGGAGIYECVRTGDIALTFDDGPYLYTNDLLDKMKSYGAKATFFLTGNNLGKGMINDPSTIYPAILRRMHAEGHQIASHTWSHENASQMTNTQFTNQMIWNEIAINSVLGFFPTYMRPPYSICERNCQNILATLGYHTIYFDLDTAGYLNDGPKQIQTSKNIWDQAMRTSNPDDDSFLQIEHDIHQQVVYNLTDYILTSLFSHGYRAVTVGECLGDPVENWYRSGPAGSVSTPTSRANPGSTTTARTTVSIRTIVSSRTSVSTRSTIPFPTTRTTAQPTIRTTTIRTTVPITTRSVIQPITTTPTLIIQPTRSTIATRPVSTRGPSTDGTCGNGITCSGTRYGACCSAFGYCGTGDDFCAPGNGCQGSWGYCEGSESQPPVTPPSSGGVSVSRDGRCGALSMQTCSGSTFGSCCGADNTCSTTTLGCLAILGCQKDYGYCV